MTSEILSKNVKYELANNFNTAIADGSFPASASFYDVADYAWFYFIVKAGTLDSALTCQVQQAATASGSLTDITGAVDIVGTGDDDKLFVIGVEVKVMTQGQRFVTLTISGAAGSNDYLDILFVGVRPDHAPVTQESTVAVIVVGG